MVWQNIKMALTNLSQAKLRSFLTMLGIVIGITAVVTVVALGEGLRSAVTQEINAIGTNLIQVSPGNTVIRNESGEIESFNFAASFGASSLTENDVELIRNIDGVEGATPVMVISGSARISEDSDTIQGAFIVATSQDYPNIITTQTIEKGQFFTDDGQSQVAIIGNEIATEYFSNSDPLGNSIFIRGQKFKIIGVMSKYQSALSFGTGQTFDRAIYLPFAAGIEINQGVPAIIEIDISVSDEARIDEVAEKITIALTQAHGGEQDFSVIKQDEFTILTDSIVSLLQSAVVGLTSISLLVAGIGVMNIMLVSVTERTKEIGIRKAVGATNAHILVQFLIEAVVLTVLGGAIGVSFSWLLGFPIESQLGIQPLFTLEAFLLAFFVTSGVGVLFGIAPAIKAARKDPIEALRYE